MQVGKLLHKVIGITIHLKRLNTLTRVVETVLKEGQLKLTDLGRSLVGGDISERSGVRIVDRFIGNEKFQAEISCVYKAVASWLVGGKKRPVIIVDWSKYPNSDSSLLRAALVGDGRPLPIYDEVHSVKLEGNHKVHKAFIEKLSTFLDKECKPIVVTDAGFRNPWFKLITNMGWDYVGRVRGDGNKMYCEEGSNDWMKVTETYAKATNSPKYLGRIMLSKSNALQTDAYLYKERKKGRKSRKKNGDIREGRKEKEMAKSGREPWLLVTSLKQSSSTAKKVVKIYKMRTQIEETFRDLKSKNYGFGLRNVNVMKEQRLPVYIVIAMLAALVAWLVGFVAENKNFRSHFQACSLKKRTISLVKLGVRVMNSKRYKVTLKEVEEALSDVREYSYV